MRVTLPWRFALTLATAEVRPQSPADQKGQITRYPSTWQDSRGVVTGLSEEPQSTIWDWSCGSAGLDWRNSWRFILFLLQPAWVRFHWFPQQMSRRGLSLVWWARASGDSRVRHIQVAGKTGKNPVLPPQPLAMQPPPMSFIFLRCGFFITLVFAWIRSGDAHRLDARSGVSANRIFARWGMAPAENEIWKCNQLDNFQDSSPYWNG